MNIFKKADILIPKDIDFSKWSVVACDQYTSQPEYWDEVKNFVADSPSALNIVFPEAFLAEGDGRISKINATMDEYLSAGIFEECLDSMIYVERTMANGKTRKGIIGAIDLEEYDFSVGSQSKIRATEGTVLERIPPRVKIRENAPLELPHVMLLIDDKEKTVIEQVEKGELIYDFDLMQNSGHLAGYLLSDFEAERILGAIAELDENADGNLLFAVGDGNHSLATAKTCWENLKPTLSAEEQENHPARFCLVEIENIHDDALEFEPIHRVVFDTDPEKLLADFKAYYPETADTDNGGQHIQYTYKGVRGDLFVKNSPSALCVGTLQKFLDEKKVNVDYIHGQDVTEKLASGENAIGFLLPAMEKSDLFRGVIADGALPRKTFSMGEAEDKRFYFEAKKIK
ncbi:MAG: DUF1015 domain-containing protein [Clostridia bacterium]|nr:DUF1015 domain-containing protein [Clostridia bacterium]